jgi:integrase
MAVVKDGVVRRGSSWSYVIRVTNHATGVSRPKWVGGFLTETAAKAARDTARVAARRGEYVDQTRTSVKTYLEEWLEGHSASVKPKTWSGYRDDLRRYVIPHIGRMRLQAVRPATLSKLYVDLLKSGGHGGKPLAVPTVRHVHRTLRKALNDAVLIDGVLSSNPALLAKLPKETRRVTRDMWTAEDLDVFLESISGHRLHAFYRVAAFTGARRGEVLHLRWSDLDLEEDIIRFEGSTGVVDGERIDGTTKGGRSRVVGIDGGTRRVLEKHRLAQAADRELAGPDWFVSGLVFTSQLGRPLHPDTPTQLMPKLIEAHNSPTTPARRNHPAEPLPRPGHQLPHVRLHDLRHLHATLLLLEGVPVHVVANRLGHSDPAVTLRVYAHVLRESASGVADVFAGAIERAAVSKSVSKTGPGDDETRGPSL